MFYNYPSSLGHCYSSHVDPAAIATEYPVFWGPLLVKSGVSLPDLSVRSGGLKWLRRYILE